MQYHETIILVNNIPRKILVITSPTAQDYTNTKQIEYIQTQGNLTTIYQYEIEGVYMAFPKDSQGHYKYQRVVSYHSTKTTQDISSQLQALNNTVIELSVLMAETIGGKANVE